MDLNHPNQRYSYYSLRSTFHAALCLISYSANFGLPSNVRYRGLTTRQEFMSALAHYGLAVPDLRVAKAFAPSKVSRFYTVVSVLSRSFIRVNIAKCHGLRNYPRLVLPLISFWTTIQLVVHFDVLHTSQRGVYSFKELIVIST